MATLRSLIPSSLKPSRKRLIAVSCVILVILLGWWWYNARARTTPRKSVLTPAGLLDQVAYAVANARSWRVSTIGTMHDQPFQSDQDVLCPSSVHTVTRTQDAAGAMSLANEMIETKDMTYAREGTDPWASTPNSAAANKCASGPMAGPTPLAAVLESVKSSNLLRRGDLLQLGAESCRVWYLIDKAGGPGGTMCVDDVTHLPYALEVGAIRVQYSNWNMPMLIEPPVK
jgi:hypothetical protein